MKMCIRIKIPVMNVGDVSLQHTCTSFCQCDRFAAGLLDLGLTPGDRVGILGPNSIEWIIAQYATARAGLILVWVDVFNKYTLLSLVMIYQSLLVFNTMF